MWHCMEHLFTRSIGELLTNLFRLGFKNKIRDCNVFTPKTLVLSNKEAAPPPEILATIAF